MDMPACQPGGAAPVALLRWGILGAAGIAGKAFLPAMAEAAGIAAAVARRGHFARLRPGSR